MYERSKTPVTNYLDGHTRDLLTKDDTIDPLLSKLFVEAGRHIPAGGLNLYGGAKLTADDVAAALDSLLGYVRHWSDRAVEAETELADLRRERDTVRAYFGATS